LLVPSFTAELLDAPAKFLGEIFVTPFQKQTNRTDSFLILFAVRQTFNARPQAAMNVILQAGMRVLPRQVHVARRYLEVPMYEMHQAMGQISRKIRAEIT